MKNIISFFLTILFVTLILYSYFYLKPIFYFILILFGIFIMVVLSIVFIAWKNQLKLNYIDFKTKRILKHLSGLYNYSSFVYLHLQEKVIDNKDCLIRIILKKYLDKKEQEAKVMEVNNDIDDEIIDHIVTFKGNLPLIFMSSYDFSLLIKLNNNYNKLGNNNCIISESVKNNKIFLEKYQQAYINNGLVNSACDEMIKIYLELCDEKSEKNEMYIDL